MELTLTGRSYAGKLTKLLNTLDDTTQAAKRTGPRPFRVLCTPGFAARWLVPRLDRLSFADQVRLRVSTGAPSTDFSANDADVVIQWADDPTPGVCTERLMQSHRFPVISPALRQRETLREPSDLLRFRLMQDETCDAWDEWFRAAGVVPRGELRGPVFPNCELATTAAEQGQGVSLAYEAIVRDTLASGRLERLFDTVTMPIIIYSVAYPESQTDDPMTRTFRDWIFAEQSLSESMVSAAE